MALSNGNATQELQEIPSTDMVKPAQGNQLLGPVQGKPIFDGPPGTLIPMNGAGSTDTCMTTDTQLAAPQLAAPQSVALQ